jgi:hypothetical protein
VTRRRLGGLAALAVLLCAGAARAAETPEDLAQKAAETWLKLVDEGKYAESWAAAAPLFKDAVTSEQWQQAAGAARTPLGPLVSRALKSRQLTHTLPGAPDGLYVVIQYDSAFKNKTAAVETITCLRGDKATWKVTGYFVR